jgi:hypothetical protein
VECGTGYLIALKSGDKAGGLLENTIVNILEDAIVAFPRDMRRELVNRYGYRGGDAAVSAALIRCVEKGVVRRLPGSLYCLASIDDAILMNALPLHDHTIRGVLEDLDLTGYSWGNLGLLAQYFYQQEHLGEAGRVLDILLMRSDLPDDQRRRFSRLWMVIRQKQEGL